MWLFSGLREEVFQRQNSPVPPGNCQTTELQQTTESNWTTHPFYFTSKPLSEKILLSGNPLLVLDEVTNHSAMTIKHLLRIVMSCFLIQREREKYIPDISLALRGSLSTRMNKRATQIAVIQSRKQSSQQRLKSNECSEEKEITLFEKSKKSSRTRTFELGLEVLNRFTDILIESGWMLQVKKSNMIRIMKPKKYIKWTGATVGINWLVSYW